MEKLIKILWILITGGIIIIIFVHFFKESLRRANRPLHQWSREERTSLISNRDGFIALFITILAAVMLKGGFWLIDAIFR